MNSIGVIPARFASTRFPGKPLCMIAGKSMIRRVYEQAKKCPTLSRVVVATDSERIRDHVDGFGGEVVMTSVHHKSGTERCAEVCRYLNASGNTQGPLIDIVINIQGDEPFIHPEQINSVANAFSDPDVQVCTLVRAIDQPADILDPNVVKVVFDLFGKALYFSRSPIPHAREEKPENWLKQRGFFSHIGIYGFREATLMKLIALPESSLETRESLEQLRWLQHGIPIHVRETEQRTRSIDTPEDLQKIVNNLT